MASESNLGPRRVRVADPFSDLLEFIVREYAITDGQKDIDLNASVD